jgi:hypothetical protein
LIERPPNAGTSHTQRSRIADEISEQNKHSHTDIGFSFRLFAEIFKLCKSFSSHWKEILFKSALALCFLTLFTSSTLAGIFSANVVLDSVALCKSPWCGFWGAIQGLGPKTGSTLLMISKEKQSAAAAQAAKCYRESSSNNGCNGLISRSVPYTRDSAALCPFNGDVCVGGVSDAVRFDTGFQNAAVLGVNSAETFLFRRSTTCAPIIVNDTHAKIVNASTGPAKWRYNYGNQGDLNYTFETPIKDFDVHFAAYIVA